jgi:hypothetical protein
MRYALIVASALLALSGCTTTRQAVADLNARWVGHNTDDFFLRYGAPRQSLKMNSGNTLYVWASSGSVPLPEVSNTYGTVSDYGTFQSTTVTDGGGDIAVVCVVQIVATPAGQIQQIVIARDTIGMWETSRCHEIFG